jgi:diamine N-acetyltransferase
MEPSFRIAAESDADLLLQLMSEYYAFDRHPFNLEKARAALTGLLREPTLGRVWLVCAGETVVGSIVLTFGYSLELLGRDAFVDSPNVKVDRPGDSEAGALACFIRC